MNKTFLVLNLWMAKVWTMKRWSIKHTRFSQWQRFYRWRTVKGYIAHLHSGSHRAVETRAHFALTERTYITNNDRRQSQDVASEYILKEIYFTPQNKKRMGIRDVVHRECIDNCSLHFFGVSSEKNVNTVIIIALHKSRLMPVFSPQQSSVSLQLLNSISYWNLTDKRNANLRPEDCLHWSSFSLSLESQKAIKHCSNLSAVHSRESHSHNKYFTALNHQVKNQAKCPLTRGSKQGKGK